MSKPALLSIFNTTFSITVFFHPALQQLPCRSRTSLLYTGISVRLIFPNPSPLSRISFPFQEGLVVGPETWSGVNAGTKESRLVTEYPVCMYLPQRGKLVSTEPEVHLVLFHCDWTMPGLEPKDHNRPRSDLVLLRYLCSGTVLYCTYMYCTYESRMDFRRP